MEVLVTAEAEVVCSKCSYKGTVVLEIPEYKLKREFRFGVERPDEDDAHITIRSLNDASLVDITGPGFGEKIKQLPPDKRVLLALSIGQITESVLGAQQMNPEGTAKIAAVLQRVGGSFKTSFRSSASVKVTEPDQEQARLLCA